MAVAAGGGACKRPVGRGTRTGNSEYFLRVKLPCTAAIRVTKIMAKSCNLQICTKLSKYMYFFQKWFTARLTSESHHRRLPSCAAKVLASNSLPFHPLSSDPHRFGRVEWSLMPPRPSSPAWHAADAHSYSCGEAAARARLAARPPCGSCRRVGRGACPSRPPVCPFRTAAAGRVLRRCPRPAGRRTTRQARASVVRCGVLGAARTAGTRRFAAARNLHGQK